MEVYISMFKKALEHRVGSAWKRRMRKIFKRHIEKDGLFTNVHIQKENGHIRESWLLQKD